MPGAHAKLGPSAADRWMTCTSSVALIDSLTEAGRIKHDDSSIFAAEGTVAHEVRELCLSVGLDPHNFIGHVMSADGYTFTVDENMAAHLQPGIDWIREMTDSPDVEIRVDLGTWLPGQFGTCDTGWLVTTSLRSTLYVSDLKYGMGENVDAVGNRQIRLYALGYWAHLGFPDVDEVVLHIDQPRKGGQKFWDISMADLLAFADEVKAAYEAILTGNTTFAPGTKACRWCPVKEVGCPARDEWLLNLIADDHSAFDGPVPKFPSPITPARRWQILRHADDIRKWLTSLYEDSLHDALAGNPDPGSKVVEGDMGDRFFTDPEAAKNILVRALGRHAFKPRQIIGITEIEKHLKPGKKKQGNPQAWEALNELVDRPSGKPRLVPAEHPKPALEPVSDDDFDDQF